MRRTQTERKRFPNFTFSLLDSDKELFNIETNSNKAYLIGKINVPGLASLRGWKGTSSDELQNISLSIYICLYQNSKNSFFIQVALNVFVATAISDTRKLMNSVRTLSVDALTVHK